MKYPIEVNEKRTINRITLKQSFLDLLNAFNVERGLIYTLKLLFVHPGKIVRLYLAEGRYKIVNAFRLLILSTALSVFVMYLSGVDDFLLEFEKGFNEGFRDTQQGDSEYIGGLMQKIFFDQYNLFLWIAIPIYGIFAYLIFKIKQYNYAEHLVIQSFYICGLNVIAIVIFPLHHIMGQDPMFYSAFFLSLIYFFYFTIKVFETKKFGAIMKTVLLFFVSNFFYFLVLFFILGIFVGYEMAAAKG
ncbi:DUF3667 domain-containing protein [Ekhidna sp.]|uniref:DUF3667 domain-containing protein n=1 Tax=Ekhidna sp. TaxID=2608089 RepID=UPI003BA9D709